MTQSVEVCVSQDNSESVLLTATVALLSRGWGGSPIFSKRCLYRDSRCTIEPNSRRSDRDPVHLDAFG